MDLSHAGLEIDRLSITRPRLLQLALDPERVAKALVEIGDPTVERDGLAGEILGQAIATGLSGQNPEVVQA